MIGINGLGRIGKSIFIQLLQHKHLQVKAINVPDFDIHNLQSYLENDSTHSYSNKIDLHIIDDKTFSINGDVIHLLNNRDASKNNWRSFGIQYVIDSTGVYLTQEKCQQHDVDYVIMCAPPKDNTPQFVMNVNHQNYNGEKIISNASCTTNCICPVLSFLEKKYQIEKANFTTIHATTSSQNTIDTNNFRNRTSRSIFNNIIPHSTGASKSIRSLIPSLDGKVKGTSLRVPVSNVSIVDLNVTIKEDVEYQTLLTEMEATGYIQVNKRNLVSSDFNTTDIPSIIDANASMQLTSNEYKLMIWYDNEWSYSAQVVRMVEHMHQYNISKNNQIHPAFIENFSFKGKNVILRVDWNVPFDQNTFEICDSFRIVSSMETLEKIIEGDPNRIMIVSHLGRPKGKEMQYSWTHFKSQIERILGRSIFILEKGIHPDSLSEFNSNHQLYLCENIRFHPEETSFTSDSKNEIVDIFNKMGQIYVNDAFGCMHRSHLSICGFNSNEKAFGYLVQKEINCLELINKNSNNQKILAVIGGGKMNDKLALLEQLSKKVNGIYIAGGNINSILKEEKYNEYIQKLENNQANIHLMKDGLASCDFQGKYTYCKANELPNDTYFFDIGMQSVIELNNIIQEYDIIFWNGTLGVVEDEKYSYGSRTFVELLVNSGKKVIIGGGDTACFVNKFKHTFYYVSTGGGASIDYISNGRLVGFDFFS